MSNMNSSGKSTEIVREMLNFLSPPDFAVQQVKAEHLDSWGISREISSLILEEPNAFFIGSLFDYLIPFRKAWGVPLELKKRLGHLDVARMAAMDVKVLQRHIKGDVRGESLHRFPLVLAQRLVLASRRLVEKYDGNAANIWGNGSSAAVVVTRLEEFKGISQKLSNMMVRILGTWFGVHLTEWNRIDIAVDRHVERVFQRTGLISIGSPAIKPLIIETARTLCPDFPGKLDDPAFRIGEKWCSSGTPQCGTEVDGHSCPLRRICPKIMYLETDNVDRSRKSYQLKCTSESNSDVADAGRPPINSVAQPD